MSGPVRVACLHTAASNVAVFDAAARGLAVELHHRVSADLLLRAETAGGLTAAIADDAARLLAELARDADVVLLTCSTVGPAVEKVADAPAPVMRVDAALADAAVRSGGRVVVLCAVATTIEPTRVLFERAAARTGAAIELRLVPDAWAAFRAGDVGRYHALIAAAADRAFADGADAVALAQASMAGAAALCVRGVPFTSPGAGLAAAAQSPARARPHSPG